MVQRVNATEHFRHIKWLHGYCAKIHSGKNIVTPISNVHFNPKEKSNHKTCFKYKITFLEHVLE